ncbi:mucin-2-like isoform X2 [Oncorhynchus keta]|uniref:mucin-2-like isoform X2 n=1 Tax=Oncorhynchus keta TaxID=8018 RepID=UPI00227C39A9|nr:mucin-2-like isoform X2 [Oncorhynchus keta]
MTIVTQEPSASPDTVTSPSPTITSGHTTVPSDITSESLTSTAGTSTSSEASTTTSEANTSAEESTATSAGLTSATVEATFSTTAVTMTPESTKDTMETTTAMSSSVTETSTSTSPETSPSQPSTITSEPATTNELTSAVTDGQISSTTVGLSSTQGTESTTAEPTDSTTAELTDSTTAAGTTLEDRTTTLEITTIPAETMTINTQGPSTSPTIEAITTTQSPTPTSTTPFLTTQTTLPFTTTPNTPSTTSTTPPTTPSTTTLITSTTPPTTTLTTPTTPSPTTLTTSTTHSTTPISTAASTTPIPTTPSTTPSTTPIPTTPSNTPTPSTTPTTPSPTTLTTTTTHSTTPTPTTPFTTPIPTTPSNTPTSTTPTNPSTASSPTSTTASASLTSTSLSTTGPPIIVTVDTIEVSTDVTVRLNKTFKEEYSHPSTQEYQDFTKNFTNDMTLLYNRTINNFIGIVIIGLRNGSVVVEHVVVLRIENGKNLSNEIAESEKQIKDILNAAKNCTTGQVGCIGVDIIGDVIVKNSTFDKESVCDTAKLDKDLRIYYHAAQIDGRLVCVSPCAPGHNREKNCNTGTCSMSRDGPVCRCNQDYWYLDSDCFGPILKRDLFAALLTLAGLVIAAAGVMVVYVPWHRRQLHRVKDIHTGQVNQWLEEDFEWPNRPNIGGHLVGSSSTTVLTENEPNPPYGGRVALQYDAEGDSLSSSSTRLPSPYHGTQAQVSRRPEIICHDYSSWGADRDAIQVIQTTATSSGQHFTLSDPGSQSELRISIQEIRTYSEI